MAKNILFPWSFPQSLPAAIFLVCGWVWMLFPLAGYAQAPSVAQADSLYRVGDYDAAAFAYRDLVRAWNSLDPDSASYYRVRAGKAFTQADNFSVAIPLFQQLLTATPPPPARIRAEAAVTLAHIYLLKREYTPGMKWVQQGLDLIATLVPPDTTVWAKACEQKAILYLYQDEPVAAHKWMTQAHDLRMAAFDSLHLEIGYSFNSLHLVLSQLDDLEGASAAIHQAWRILTLHLPLDHPHIAVAANNLATNLMDMGDPKGAQHYLMQAIASNQAGGRARSLIGNYFNVSYVYLNLGELEIAEAYTLRALALADSLSDVPPEERATILDGLGASNFHRNQLDAAEAYFRRAYAERVARLGPGHSQLAQSIFSFGLVARARGDTALARRHLQASLDMRTKALGTKSIKRVDALGEIAVIDWAGGRYATALARWRESLQVYRVAGGPTHRYTLEVYTRLASAFRDLGQRDSARAYLEAAWRGVDGQSGATEPPPVFSPELLNLANEQLDFWLDAPVAGHRPVAWHKRAVFIRRMLRWLPDFMALYAGETGPEVQAFYRRTARLAHAALEAAAPDRLRWEGILLDALQSSRGARIRAALRQQQVRAFAGVPDSLVRRGQELEAQLRFAYGRELEGQLHFVHGQGLDKSLSQATVARRASLLEAWQAHQALLQQAFPAYYQARYATEAIDPVEWRTQLGDTAVLIYLDLDSALLITRGTATGLSTHYLPLPVGWQDSLAVYSRLLRHQADPDHLAALGYYLYRHLWEPLAAELPHRVRILPDGPLYQLSFETLLQSLPPLGTPPARWAFVLRSHCLSYAHSLWPESPGRLRPGRILGVAPGFTAEVKTAYAHSLPPAQAPDSTFLAWVSTPWSLDFVVSLARQREAETLTGLAATETAVWAAAGRASILHFATHARLADDDPLRSFLALVPAPRAAEDGYLYTYELYQQPLQAQLAVLTACETGLGHYEPGEGVLSLAHAFRYAGCPSVIYSLWPIDDARSQVLVADFYAQLGAGQPAAEALRAAKLAYLDQGEMDHPYFWAGLVLTGANPPVRAPRPWPAMFLGLSALAMGSVLVYRYRRSRA